MTAAALYLALVFGGTGLLICATTYLFRFMGWEEID
jgi:hypothetical protein